MSFPAPTKMLQDGDGRYSFISTAGKRAPTVSRNHLRVFIYEHRHDEPERANTVRQLPDVLVAVQPRVSRIESKR